MPVIRTLWPSDRLTVGSGGSTLIITGAGTNVPDNRVAEVNAAASAARIQLVTAGQAGSTGLPTLDQRVAAIESLFTNAGNSGDAALVRTNVLAAVKAGSGITATVDSGAGTVTIAATGGGGSTTLSGLTDLTTTGAAVGSITALRKKPDGGYLLVDPRNPFTPLRRALDAGGHVHIGVLSDSTGNETDEWPYLLGARIATERPALNVEYRLWSDTRQRFDPVVMLATGSGGRGGVTIGSSASLRPTMAPAARTSPNLDVAVRATPSAGWNPASGNASLMSQLGSAGARVFDFKVSNTGTLSLDIWPDGITQDGSIAATAAHTLASATEGWLRVTLVCNDGSGNKVANFYQSTDGITWTQIGSTRTIAGTTSLYAGTSQRIEIGGRNGGNIWAGTTIWAAENRDGIDGPLLVTPRAQEWIVDPAANDVTIGGQTLTIWNGAQPGQGISYLGDAARLPKLVPPCDLVLMGLSTSHNELYSQSGAWRKLYTDWMAAIRGRSPNVPFVLMTQNPRRTPAGVIREHEARCKAIVGWTGMPGVSVIDTYNAFLADGRPLTTLVNADGIHPSTPDGKTLWSTVVNGVYDRS